MIDKDVVRSLVRGIIDDKIDEQIQASVTQKQSSSDVTEEELYEKFKDGTLDSLEQKERFLDCLRSDVTQVEGWILDGHSLDHPTKETKWLASRAEETQYLVGLVASRINGDDRISKQPNVYQLSIIASWAEALDVACVNIQQNEDDITGDDASVDFDPMGK